MSYPNVLFDTQLESLDTRRNNISRSFFQDICKPTSCLHHLIPPPQDTSVTARLRLTTSLPRPNLHTKKVLFIHKLWPTPLPTNIVTPNPLHTSLPAPKYIYAHCLFCILFLSVISTAYHLLSGSRAARLLLNWFIDWIGNHWWTHQLFKYYL